jgi:hypothetical protein
MTWASPERGTRYDRLVAATFPRALGLVKPKLPGLFAGLAVPGLFEEGRKSSGGAVGCPAPDLYGCHPRPVNGYQNLFTLAAGERGTFSSAVFFCFGSGQLRGAQLQ